MPRDLTPAQVALLLSIDEATWPLSKMDEGLRVNQSTDRYRLARDGFILCRRTGTGRTFRWRTTDRGKNRAARARIEAAERTAARP